VKNVGKIATSLAISMLLAAPSIASAQVAGGQTNLSRAAIQAISANMRVSQKLQRRNYQAGAEGGGGGGLSTGAIVGIGFGVGVLAGGIAVAVSGNSSHANSP
jgi:hypothetical protein